MVQTVGNILNIFCALPSLLYALSSLVPSAVSLAASAFLYSGYSSYAFFLPYQLYYYADEGKSEAEATKFELQLEPTAALKKAGLRSCTIQVRKNTYDAFAKQPSLAGNNDERYALVRVYWDKLTRSPSCYSGFDSVEVIEQYKASQFAKVNQASFQTLFETKP